MRGWEGPSPRGEEDEEKISNRTVDSTVRFIHFAQIVLGYEVLRGNLGPRRVPGRSLRTSLWRGSNRRREHRVL